MKIQDIMATLGVAAVTMAFSLGLAVTRFVDAVDQTEPVAHKITPLIQQPTLSLDGLVITLAMDKASYEPGDQPVVMLEATNPTDRKIETKVWIGMTSSTLASRFSRAPTLPNYFWTRNVPLALDAGESKQIRIATEKAWGAAGNSGAATSVAITMSDAKQQAVFAKLLSAARAASPAAATPVTPGD